MIKKENMNKNIHLIIFSKDRACQLHCLLNSIATYAQDVFVTSVIYTFSNKEFEKGYDKLWSKSPVVPLHMRYEEDFGGFEKTVKSTIDMFGYKYVAFSTDDTIIFKKIDTQMLKEALPQLYNQCFSFRLGENTIQQDIHNNTIQPPLNLKVQHNGWLSWPVYAYHPHHNYGYPFGLDLHIFRRNMIKPIVEDLEFNSTNQLESQLINGFRHKVDELRSFNESVAVNIPINSVTNITQTGMFSPISLEELNQKFLDGWIIDLDDLSKKEYKGCHQEADFRFIKC